jgi:hypothetical protein
LDNLVLSMDTPFRLLICALDKRMQGSSKERAMRMFPGSFSNWFSRKRLAD